MLLTNTLHMTKNNPTKLGEFFYTSFMLNKLKNNDSISDARPIKILVKYGDIESITTKNQPKNWVCASTVDGRKVFKEISLDRFVREICYQGIVKTSKNEAVNLFCVNGINSNCLFIGEKCFRVSRTFKKNVFDLLYTYFSNP